MPLTVAPSDIYPAVRRYLLESGLQRSLKVFDKETAYVEEDAPPKGKKAKLLAELELVAASQLWLDSRLGAGAAASATNGTVAEAPIKKKKQVSEETEVTQPEAVEEAPPKKRKRVVEEEAAEEAEVKPKESKKAEAVQEAVPEAPKKKNKNKKGQEPEDGSPKSGTPFKRIDESKWTSVIKDSRLLDNTHKAKQKFGNSAGDTWADKASEDLLKVKGKGFRKEMAKKKRASWRGGGELDQGVNSIKFESSDDE